MKLNRSICAFLVVLIAASGVLSHANDTWYQHVKKIKLLKSTMKDVTEVLGKPRPDSPVYFSQYDLPDALLQIEYSTGLCAQASSGWNVPEFTVTRIFVNPKKRIKLRNLPFNLTGFSRRPIEDVPGAYFYDNGEKGIDFGLRPDNSVGTITYYPTTITDGYRCSSVRPPPVQS